MLLSVAWYKHHHNDHFLDLLHLRSCLDLFFIFIFIFITINRKISWIETHLFFCLFFRMYPAIFGWQSVYRVRKIFKKQKFSLRVLLSICIIFCRFQTGVAYKSVAYKKKRIKLFKKFVTITYFNRLLLSFLNISFL